MGADEEVRQDPRSPSSLFAVCAPHAAGQKMGLPVQWFDADFVGMQKTIAIPMRPEMYAKFGVNEVAND